MGRPKGSKNSKAEAIKEYADATNELGTNQEAEKEAEDEPAEPQNTDEKINDLDKRINILSDNDQKLTILITSIKNIVVQTLPPKIEGLRRQLDRVCQSDKNVQEIDKKIEQNKQELTKALNSLGAGIGVQDYQTFQSQRSQVALIISHSIKTLDISLTTLQQFQNNFINFSNDFKSTLDQTIKLNEALETEFERYVYDQYKKRGYLKQPNQDQ